MVKKLLEQNFFLEFQKYMSKLGVSRKEYKNAFIDNKWIGTNLCGPSSVIVYKILKDYDYTNINIYSNYILSKDYSEDHTFLIVNDNIYIDPTFNQLLPKINDFKENWFVGKYEDIDKYSIEKYLFKKQINITEKVNKFINLNFKNN